MLALVVAALMVPPTAADAAPEFEILDAYLGEHDVGGSWAHCQRHGGADVFREVPDIPLPAPAPYTNELLRHHVMWHKERLSLTTGDAPSASDTDRYGDDFYSFHRAMVLDYDAWRLEQGYPPVAPWDPATPIPPEFAYDAPTPACQPRKKEDPKLPLPAWATLAGGETDPFFHEYRALCEFPDLNRLAKAIDGHGPETYHSKVHDNVSGDMNLPPTAPRDPIFWGWHKFLDEAVFRTWERECGAPPSDAEASASGARVERDRAVPAPFVLASLVLAALVLRRARRE